MSAEKNALRNKLDDFEYGYRDGAWERFEKMLEGTEPLSAPPSMPGPSVKKDPWNRKLGVLLGVAGAVAVLFAGWLVLIPGEGTESRSSKGTSNTETQKIPLEKDQVLQQEKSAVPDQIKEEGISPAPVNETSKSIEGQSLTNSANNVENPVKSKPAFEKSKLKRSEKSDDSGRTGDKLKEDRSAKRLGPDKKLDRWSPGKLPGPPDGTPPPDFRVFSMPFIPPARDTNTGKVLVKVFPEFDILPFPSLNLSTQNDSLPRNTLSIKPFLEEPLVLKKHEIGFYVDVAGPFHGNYLVGGEYNRIWNRYTETSIGIGFQYLFETHYINDTRFGTFATHLLATQYVSLLQRPDWHFRLGVGYRLSNLQVIRHSKSNIPSPEYESSDKRDLLFTAELKRRWRKDDWVGLRYTAMHWAANVNVYICRQF